MLFRTGFVGRQIVAGSGSAPPSLALSFMTPGVLDPRIVFTRASSGTYFDATGTMQNAGINQVRNSMMLGAVAGAPGTLPTNWTVQTTPGLAWSVIGTGIEDGITYIDMRLSGTTSSAAPSFVHFDPVGFATAVGQTWALSFYVRLVGGSLTNTTNISSLIFEQPSGAQHSTAAILPSNAPLTTQRTQNIFTMVTAGTNNTIGSLKINNTGAGVPIDATFRIGAPQMEQGATVSPFIPTYGVANSAPRWDYDPIAHTLRGLLMEDAHTNLLPNSMMTGAVAASPGTDPTGWLVAAVGGLTKTIVGIGVESGMTYIDYRFNAAAGTGGNLNFIMSPSNVAGIPVAAGQAYTYSFYMSLQAGSLAGLSGFTAKINQWDAGAVSLGVQTSLIANFTGFNLGDPIAKSRVIYTPTTVANTAFIQPFFQIPIPAGAFDFTLRIAAPQFELGALVSSFIPTISAAVTRAADFATVANSGWLGATHTIASDYIVPYATLVPGSAYVSLQLDDGTNTNAYMLRNTGVGNTLDSRVFAANVSAGNAPGLVFTANTLLKAITTFNVPGLAATALVNGGTPVPYTFSAAPAGISRLSIGNGRTGALNGWVQRARYWPRVLSNAEMQQAAV